MTDVPSGVQAELQTAVTPTDAEVVRAKQVIIDALQTGGSVPTGDLVATVITDGGGESAQGRDDFIQLHGAIRNGDPVDPDQPIIKTTRLRLAANEALAALATDGDLTAVARPSPGGNLQLPTGNMSSGGGWRGSTAVVADQPILQEAYRLSRRHLDKPALTEIVASLNADPLADLLGPRGVRCFGEAVLAFRRGLYLAAVNLAAASSEAAWFALGTAAVPSARGTALQTAIDADNTAKVIQLVTQNLQATPGLSMTMTELSAQAVYLRDLRNYAVHPRSGNDQQLEAHFTEVGSLVLLLMTRRYLERLRDAGRLAGLL